MRPEEDAFGQEIYDFYQGNSAVEIIERDDGFVDVSAGPPAYFAPFAGWPSIEQEAIQLAHGRVLDVGCGAGRVCLYLQEQGHEVVGIDNSPLAIKTARLRGVADARLLSITQVSRKELGVFDTIVMYGNNFGLFGNPKRAGWLLRRFYGMTGKNGRILAETRNIYQTDNPDHLAFHEQNRRQGRMAGQLRIRVRYKRLVGPWFEYLMVSPQEMEALVAGAGWRMERLFEAKGDSTYIAVLAKS